ncbi:hypothetical protein PTTW11_03137 [Pyrenophora teres f. teres]|uniref:Heterokaryon incompatibility domain-containing protein n=1 Tax=Pyrenophora teres f. teres TaxID=97479 RepID=A0A6S6VJ14_9PLEO|nr:hypothetical protein PTTW11_03137 [Pyrenophora teres f. teres]
MCAQQRRLLLLYSFYLCPPVLCTATKSASILDRACRNTMRLLKRLPAGGGFELMSFSNGLAPQYAILSHTWTDGQEVTYNKLLVGTGANKRGYANIRFCGERAAADGLEYF